LEKLTYDQIVAIHLEIESGEEIVFSEKRLRSNIEFLNQFDDLSWYATHLICTIIRDDIFEKYNLETALITLDFFLRHNGYTLGDNDEQRKRMSELLHNIQTANELKKDELAKIRNTLKELITKD
jgi:prophage maintenance system killer protein